MQILLPYHRCGCYILFAFNLSEKTITILDPIPLSDVWKNNIVNKYILKLKDISFYLNIALQAAIPGWNDDVFLWRRIRPTILTRNYDRLLNVYRFYYRCVVQYFTYNTSHNNNVYIYTATCLVFWY